MSGTQETFEALSHFLYYVEVTLKEYKNDAHIDLVHKYNIKNNTNVIELINPYHISYISSLQYNTLRYFYSVLEKIDVEKREELLADTYYLFTKIKSKKPMDLNL